MNIHRLLYLFGKTQNPPKNSFSEKRLVWKGGNKEKPSDEGKQPSLEGQLAALEKEAEELEEKVERVSKLIEERETKKRKEIEVDLTEADPVFARLDNETYQNILDGKPIEQVERKIFIYDLTIEQVDTLLVFWKDENKPLDDLRTITDQIALGALSPESTKIVIEAFKGEDTDLKKFFGMFIEYQDGGALDNIIEACSDDDATLTIFLDELFRIRQDESFEGLSNKSLAIIITTVGLTKKIREKLSIIQKIALLGAYINEEDKVNLFKEVMEKKAELKELIPYQAKIMLEYAFKDKGKNKDAIGKLKKGLGPDTKIGVIKELGKDSEIGKALYDSLSAKDKKEVDKLFKKVEKVKAKKTNELFKEFPEKKGKKYPFTARIAAAFKGEKHRIRGKMIYFSVSPESKTRRSFWMSDEFKKTVMDCRTPADVKLACYEELLRIIEHDGSINSNKWKLENFRESNTALVQEIVRLEASIVAEGEEIDQTAVQQDALKELTTATFGKGGKTYRIEYGVAKVTTGKTLEKIYAEMSTKWEGKRKPANAPFTKDEFITANVELAKKKPEEIKGQELFLPFKGFELPKRKKEVAPAAAPKEAPAAAAAVEAKAMAKLKEAGLLIKKETIEKLTVEQYSTLKDAATKFKEAFKTAPNAIAILKVLRKIGRAIWDLDLGEDTEIQFTEEITGKTFKWADKSGEKNGGFGEKYQLIEKILAIKREELGKNSEKYITFRNQSTKAGYIEEKEERKSTKLSEYREKFKELATRRYKLDPKIGALWEGDIADYWPHFRNHGLVDPVMMRFPFGLPDVPRAGLIAAKIISDGRNDRVYFKDIFKYMGGFPLVARKGEIPIELLKDGDDFKEKFEQLMEDESDPNLLNAMLTDILAPCLELLEAMSQLRFPEGVEDTDSLGDADQLEIVKKSIPEDQLPIIEGLAKLFGYSEDPAGAWDKFLGWLGGAETITMANMDGRTFDVDEGMLKRHFAPTAALLIMLETRGLYTIENGEKKLNEEKILAEVNKMMKRGYVIMLLQKATPAEGKKLSPEEVILVREQVEEESAKYQITSLRAFESFTKEQMMAFQLGFINTKIEESERKVEEGIDAEAEARLEGMTFKNPGERAVMKGLIIEGIKAGNVPPPKILKEIHSKLALTGHIHYHDGKFAGAGIGTGIKLSDNSTLLIGVGLNISRSGPAVIGALGISIKLTGGPGWNINYNAYVRVSGIGTGLTGSYEFGDSGIEVHGGAGLELSWTNVLNLGVAAGVGLSWDKAFIRAEEAREMEKVAEETGWGEVLNKWGELPVNEKYEILQKSPQWDYIKVLMDKYPDYLTKENLIRAYDRHIEIQKASVHKEMESYLPSLIPRGLGFGGVAGAGLGFLAGGPLGAVLGGVIAGAKFKIGSVEIFIPHPKEELRILKLATNANLNRKVKEFFEKLKTGEITLSFEERTPDLYWKPGSPLGKGIRIKSRQIDLSSLETGIKSYNEALAPAEVELKNTGGRTELIIGGLFNRDSIADKDLEIHIDPTLRGLCTIADGGRIFIEGDINNLIITRERFKFSHMQAKGRSCIRDMITIRQKSSVEGPTKIDRQWLEEFEGSYLEILMGRKKFTRQLGANYTAGQANLVELHGFVEMEKWHEHELVEYYYNSRPEILKLGAEGRVLDKAKLETMKGEIEGMHDILGAVLKTEYLDKKPREKFFEELTQLYKEPEFFAEFETKVNEPEAIMALIKKYANDTKYKGLGLENLSDKELAMTENFLRNLWFTTAYGISRGTKLNKLSSKKLLKENAIDAKLIRKLRRAGFRNLRMLDLLTPEDIVKRSKEKITPEEAKLVVQAVIAFKERPLSKKELIRKNKELIKRIEGVRDWCKGKYIQEFNEIREGIEPSITTSTGTLVNEFMGGIYTDLLKELSRTQTPPPILDFRNLKIAEIPTGSTLISGSRVGEKGKRVRAFTTTLSYEQIPQSEAQIHAYGFLQSLEGKSYGKGYSLKNPDTSGTEGEIARILLEMASPIPEDNIELLKSPLAIKILGLGAYRLIAGDENYKAMKEILKSDDLKFAKSDESKYQKAMTQFKKLIEDIRAQQYKGDEFTIKLDTGHLATIDMVSGTVIHSGAFSQCTNPSFYVHEKGKAKAHRPKRGVFAAREEITQITEAETDIAAIHFVLSAGITKTKKPGKRPPEEKPEATAEGEARPAAEAKPPEGEIPKDQYGGGGLQ